MPGPHAVGEAAPISQKLFSGQIVHLVWWYSPVYEPTVRVRVRVRARVRVGLGLGLGLGLRREFGLG